MFTIIANHYIPEITPINPCIIHFKNIYIHNIYTIFTLKVIFLETTILKLGRAHREKFYRECFETRHIYSGKGCIQDDDFILHKMYHILKLLCNMSPKTRDSF